MAPNPHPEADSQAILASSPIDLRNGGLRRLSAKKASLYSLNDRIEV